MFSICHRSKEEYDFGVYGKSSIDVKLLFQDKIEAKKKRKRTTSGAKSPGKPKRTSRSLLQHVYDPETRIRLNIYDTRDENVGLLYFVTEIDDSIKESLKTDQKFKSHPWIIFICCKEDAGTLEPKIKRYMNNHPLCVMDLSTLSVISFAEMVNETRVATNLVKGGVELRQKN